MPQEIGIGFVVAVVVCLILLASTIFISQDDFNHFMDWLTGPIFRYFERRRKARRDADKKWFAEKKKKILTDAQFKLDKRKAEVEDLRVKRLKTVELIKNFCIKAPDNLLNTKLDRVLRGCFNIRDGYVFIIDDNGCGWLGLYSPSLIACLRGHYEKRDIDVPIKGIGQKISGNPMTIDGEKIDVYPKWFTTTYGDEAVLSKWAKLYKSFHASDLSFAWVESFEHYYTPAHSEMAVYLNRILLDAEHDIEQSQKLIKIREVMDNSMSYLDDPEVIRMLKRLGDMDPSEKAKLYSKI